MCLSGREPPALRAIVGVPAYNEGQNIDDLLRLLCRTISADSRIEKIVIISSSTDSTNRIVSGWSLADPRVVLLTERGRSGKASAWNALVDLAEKDGIDAMIYMGADNIPLHNSMSLLLDELEKGFGIVGGRPVPVDSKDSLVGWCTNLQWNLHHVINRDVKPKVSGELCAFRIKVVREMPPGLINDDTYLERLFEMRGYKVGYCQFAEALLKGPSTLSDLMNQRRRIYIGHHQIRMYTGHRPSTIWYGNLLLIKKALPSWGFRPFIYLILDILLQGIAYITAKLDFHFGNLPYKWKMAQTTKSLKNGI